MVKGKSRHWWPEIRSKVKSRLFNMTISAKIIIYYLALLLLSVVLSSILYQQVFFKITTGMVSNISIQMLHSLSESLDTVVDIVGDYSKQIISNEEISNVLRRAALHVGFGNRFKAESVMNRIIGGCSYISSVYIFDRHGNRYGVDKGVFKSLINKDITRASWYQAVLQKSGGYILALNAGGIFKPARSRENFVSLIRVINDIDSQKPLGILLVNIPESVLRKMFNSGVVNYRKEVLLLDQNNRPVFSGSRQINLNVKPFMASIGDRNQKWQVQKVRSTQYIVSYLKIPSNGWKIISVIPFRELAKEAGAFGVITFFIIVLNGVLLLVGSIIISRYITVPIKQLLVAMKEVEKGAFQKVSLRAGNYEFGKLQDGYNSMIDKIENLITNIIQEQKMKRKAELDVLQAQIKPHFLYNTFDAISSLALSGKNKDVYEIMKALGTYYRTSLSQGREIITIREEIEVVANYLKIMQYRNEDLLAVEYEIDERVLEYPILKLVLQPFVENAIYHGIKPLGAKGVIRLSAAYHPGYIVIQINDTGVGMDSATVAKLTTGTTARNKPGFGVWGTIERLRIVYGVEEIVFVASQPGRGTCVTIQIPILKGLIEND
jgi:two-component system sensor histidine kinase YesM